MATLAKRLDFLEPLVQAQSGSLEKSIYGVVDRVDMIDGVKVPHFIRKWTGSIGNMVPCEGEPTIYLIEKLEPMILKHKKHKGMFGGRGGTKSRFAQDIMGGEINGCGSKVYVLRERMKALKESIYAGIVKSIKDLNLGGFVPVPSHWEIRHRSGGKFTFGGMMNIIDMKGSSNYKYFLMEESARTKQETIDTLGPTLRDTPGAELWWLWNTESASDPMSLEFIVPYQEQLDRDGYYEDDHYLIIKVGYRDNPWFEHDESLSGELRKDKEKVEDGRMSQARYDGIWEGAFNDDVENALIPAIYFDACIDAHIKLGFKPVGVKVATHDPADVGKDSKAVSMRQGSVFTDMEELEAENANVGIDLACGWARQRQVDSFGWDCDGLGAPLRVQVADAFKGTNVKTFMFKGSEGVHNPDAIFSSGEEYGIGNAVKNKDAMRNKRAQNYLKLAERCRKTWEAVDKGIYHNPDDLISFSSSIKCLQKLRSEICRLPLKPNSGGMVELYSKADMAKGIVLPSGQKIKLPSPGLADCTMMSLDEEATYVQVAPAIMPKPIRSMGRR